MGPTRELEADVAVVGAGLAGLSAARAVQAAGATAVVVEARDRVGGRLLRHELGDGAWVDLGGQWLGPTQHRANALAAELGREMFPTYTEGESAIEWDGRVRRFRGLIPRISPLVLADTQLAITRLDRMARRVPPEAPWSAPRAERWDEQTFATWLRRNVRTAGARTMLELACEAVWAAEPADVSLLHLLFYIRSAGRFDDLLGTSGGAQQDRFVEGAQGMALALAERVGAEHVVLGAPVRRIEAAGGVVVRGEGALVRARRVVVAVPPALAGRIEYDPPLPAIRDQLTQRMPQGSVIKTMSVYDEPFWRADGLNGQAVSDAGPARVVFDNSPPSGRPGVLLAFLEGRFARELAQVDEPTRRAAVVGTLARVFGPRAAKPDAYLERVWADEPWTRGCYGCYMPTGGWTQFGAALRAPIGPIHWAGAETATVWNGYMDGAISSGERAASEALAAL